MLKQICVNLIILLCVGSSFAVLEDSNFKNSHKSLQEECSLEFNKNQVENVILSFLLSNLLKLFVNFNQVEIFAVFNLFLHLLIGEYETHQTYADMCFNIKIDVSLRGRKLNNH